MVANGLPLPRPSQPHSTERIRLTEQQL